MPIKVSNTEIMLAAYSAGLSAVVPNSVFAAVFFRALPNMEALASKEKTRLTANINNIKINDIFLIFIEVLPQAQRQQNKI